MNIYELGAYARETHLKLDKLGGWQTFRTPGSPWLALVQGLWSLPRLRLLFPDLESVS